MPLLLALTVASSLTTPALAGKDRRIRCKEGEDRRVVLVPRSCEAEFQSRDLSLDLGLNASALSAGDVNGDLSVTSSVVRYQDAINEAMSLQYIGLCEAWKRDPCSHDAAEELTRAQLELAKLSSTLRIRLAEIEATPESASDVAHLLQEVQGAFTDQNRELESLSQRATLALERLEQTLHDDASEPDSWHPDGLWAVTAAADSPGACTGEFPARTRWSITTEDGTALLQVDGEAGGPSRSIPGQKVQDRLLFAFENDGKSVHVELWRDGETLSGRMKVDSDDFSCPSYAYNLSGSR